MQKQKGFAAVGILIVIGALVTVALALSIKEAKRVEQTGGASVTDTQLSDTIGTFRTNVNTSLDNINTELETVSSTQHSYGTIATQNIPLPASAGGTGTTSTPSNGQFLSAVGTSPAWKNLAFGAGLSVTTTATSVSVNTTGIDPSANYAWSGNNTHSGTEAFNGTTTAPYLAPAGEVEAYVSSTAPNGWLLCNGQQVATATYPSLFALIGYAYGGSTSTFSVPDLRGRFLAGASSTLSTTVGATGGATSSVSGPYTIASTYSNVSFGGGLNGLVNQGSYSTNSSTVATVPPYFIVNYIIKY